MPRMLAAWVRLPRQWSSVSRIRSRSTSATVRPTRPRVDGRGRHRRRSARGSCGGRARRWPTCVPSGRRMASGAISGAVRQQHGAMDGVFQLAHIAAPAMAQQQPLGRRRDRARYGTPLASAYLLGEMLGQGADVLGPLAQRGQAQIHDIQAIEQVFAERAVLDGFRQVAVGGGDDADVDLDRLGAADPVDLALLDGAQQLGLQARVHLADFVQQQRAAIGFLELADAPGDGAGEGALLVAEQFGFQQVFRDGGAIDRDEGLVGARAICGGRSGPALPCRCRFRR